MRRRLALCLVALICLFSASAQEQFEQEKKRINEIKRSADYIYAEGIDVDEAGARELAESALISAVNREVMNKPELQLADQVIINVVSEHSDQVKLMRGSMYRLFLYVQKKDLLPGYHANEQAAAKEEPLIEEPPTEPDDFIDNETKVRPEVTLSDEEVKAVTAPLPEETAPPTTPRHTGVAFIDAVNSFTHVTNLQSYLNELKERGRLMFGRMDTNLAKVNSYLVVFDSQGRIVAFLDKGGEARTNLKTGKENDRVSNYPKHGVVWIQLL